MQRRNLEVKLGFAYRIALVLALTLAAGTALTSVLSLHKFERILADLLTSRFEYVVNDLRHRIETQMDLGLSLANLVSINDELDELLNEDGQILSVEVFDETGSVLFSTDPSFIGDLVSEDWMFAWQVSRDKGSWSMLENDASVVGVGLQNNLNQDVGSVALRYSRQFLDSSVSQQFERIVVLGVVIALAMALFSMFGCTALLRSYIHDWKNMREALADIRNGRRGSENLIEANTRHPEFQEFSNSVFDAMDSLESSTNDLRRLDEHNG